MAKINFPKKQEQRLIPKYLLEYAEELQENHPDPSAEWGSQGTEYTAGEGIIIEDDTISVDTEDVAMVSNLATVAFSGSYNDLSNTPTIPTKTSDLNNDSGFITGIDSADVISALGYTPGTSNFSGDYDDLTDKPDLSVYELKSEAFSGDYNDLTNKPTIPTAVSQLTNDSGYITGINSTDVVNALGYTPGTSNFSGDYTDLTNKPTIPTATSQLTNDSGFITSSDLPTNHVTTDTAQDITGAKTFKTNPIRVINSSKGIQLLSGTNGSTSAKLGFTLYNASTNNSTYESGFLEGNTQTKDLMLGYYNQNGRTATISRDWKVGFAYYGYYGSTTDSYSAYKLVLPNRYNLKSYNTYRYFPIDFTDGTTTVRADETGIVDISSLLPDVPSLTGYTKFITKTTGTNFTSDEMSDLEADGTILFIDGECYTKEFYAVSPFYLYYIRMDASPNNNQIVRTSINILSDGSWTKITDNFIIPTATSDLTNDSGFITGITSSDVTTALGYTPGTSNFSGSYTDLTDKPSIPSTATSTSTVTPSTSSFMTSTTKTTETLTFTYDDDTTATITVVTSVTDNTSSAMTGASVSTTTTLS